MLHYFNPGHETAVLNASPYYTPGAGQRKMQSDLAFLPAWYAASGDFVLVPENLPDDFVRSLHPFILPKAVTEYDLEYFRQDLSVREISFWGISPHSVNFFRQLGQKYGLNFSGLEIPDGYIELSGRRTAAECLNFLIESVPRISPHILPHFFSDRERIEQFIRKEQMPCVIKSPYSSSGRGLLWIPSGSLSRSAAQILSGMLNKQKEVSVERVLDKHADFSAQFISDGGGKVDFVGFSLFKTNEKGAYEGSRILSQEEIELFFLRFIDVSRLEIVKYQLIDFLTHKVSYRYKGNIGVDMMIYKENDRYCLHPCVEINLRKNMGYLAVKLYENSVTKGCRGFFQITFDKQPGSIYSKHREMQNSRPPVFENNRITSGYLSLCPVNQESKYHAFLSVCPPQRSNSGAFR
ncbi:MAG: hypothetical protein FWF54_05085 [Candidatus Azobacteroides sp.]|nr:hypothetical protein [Candidatus Azobacteroides sp.]